MVALSNASQPSVQSDDLEQVESLDRLALQYLASVEHAFITWFQKPGGGCYGFRVWTPLRGHIVTVLEV